MQENRPTTQEWKRLYQAMIEIKKMAPWGYFEESDLFVVEDPETNEVGFVSIMGAYGDHYGISLYIGEKGLWGYLDLTDTGVEEFDRQLFFETPQLQASIENREELHDTDRELIKELGLSFRGKKAWPLFRSFRPGYFPWYLTDTEARFLTHALEQLIEIAPHFEKDPEYFNTGKKDALFMRKATLKGKKLSWKNSYYEIKLPEGVSLRSNVDVNIMQHVQDMPSNGKTLEIDFFITTAPIQEQIERPFFPYAVIMLDHEKDIIVGHDMLAPVPDLETMWGQLPASILTKISEMQQKPGKILVCSDLLHQVLQAACLHTNIQLEFVPELPHMEMVRQSFLNFMQ